MFTGIVRNVGTVVSVEDAGGDVRVRVDVGPLPPASLALGASIAINGVCLTVVRAAGTVVDFDVSRETMGRTSIGAAQAGARVNVEPALTLEDPLGGHLVSGHVDGQGTVVAVDQDARSVRMGFRVPAELGRYVAAKGSLCVDGVSLTVNTVDGDVACVNVVPHTLTHTIMGSYRIGSAVNIEVDLVARYLERLIASRT